MAKKTSAATKGMVVGGPTVGLLGYAAMWLSQKYSVPMEVTAGALTLVGGLVSRWAGKLVP